MWEFIDKAIYINLDHRQDRREIMNKFFEEGLIPNEKIIRYSAVSHSDGIIGCALSHIGVLKMAKQHNWKSVLILEDDLQWMKFDIGYKMLETISHEHWDVCLLTGLYIDVNYPKLSSGMYTNAYIVKEHYYDTLIDNMEEGLRKKLSVVKPHIWDKSKMKLYTDVYKHVYNVDVYWIKLQQRDNWIAVDPICCQTPTYSDINKQIIYVPCGISVGGYIYDNARRIIAHLI